MQVRLESPARYEHSSLLSLPASQVEVKLSKIGSNGLYYKPITIITIVNDNFRAINKLGTSLIDGARVVIYDHYMFILQATGLNVIRLFSEEAK